MNPSAGENRDIPFDRRRRKFHTIRRDVHHPGEPQHRSAQLQVQPARQCRSTMVILVTRLLLAVAGVVVSGASPLGCFVEVPSSSVTKNMCERAFDRFPAVADATACAAQCVADKDCVMFAWELQPKPPQCRLSSTCTTPTNALAGFDGYYRNSTAGQCAPRPGPPPPVPGGGVPGNWSRVFLNTAAAKGAVCIDGSPGAYYIRTANAAGVPSDKSRFVLFMEGGGWTSSLKGR
jgi:hypothetical protein